MAVVGGEIHRTGGGSTVRRDPLAGFVQAVAHPGGIAVAQGVRASANRTRRWTINGDFLGLKPTGVARYATETTLALDALVAAEHPLTRGLSLRIVAPRSTSLPVRSIPVDVVPEYTRPRLPQFWVQAQLPRHVDGGLLSFCNLARSVCGGRLSACTTLTPGLCLKVTAVCSDGCIGRYCPY